MTDPTEASAKQARGRGAFHIYEVLRREILTLALAPGTPLDETTLSGRFGMSRSPVREALVRLSGEGLVVMLSNRSTLVAPIDLAAFPRYVEALDLLQRINTRLAARHRSEAQIDTMTALARAFDDACQSNDFLEMSATNRDFHMAIAEAGQNPYLARAYGQMLDEGRRILHMHFAYIQRSASEHLLNADHYEMIEAIRAGDVNRADHLAHHHTRQFQDRFLNYLRARYEDEFSLDPPAGI